MNLARYLPPGLVKHSCVIGNAIASKNRSQQHLVAATGVAFAACLSLILISCAGESEWATRAVWEQVDTTESSMLREYADAGAVILLDEGRMEIFGGDEFGFSQFEQHRIVRILDVRGHQYANVVIPYNAESRVEEVRARTISASGKISLLEEKNLFDVNLYPSFVLFSDQRAKLFTFPAVEDGALVEYRYRVLVRSRTFWHAWRFQSDVPTVLSRFTLLKPGEWDVHHRTYGIHLEPRVMNAPSGFKSTHVWEARNLPPLRSEFSMPPASEQVARLALAPIGFNTWGDVSRWYQALVTPRMNAGADLRSAVRQLVQGVTDDTEKLRRIYEWVRDNLRYVAVEIGVGGYQPHAVDEIFANRYGDCKDMVTVLCAMGAEVGLDVRQALVSTWQNGAPDTSLPSPLQFNHVIACAPSVRSGPIWMDATEKGCVFGRLPWYDQGLPVLVLGEKKEKCLVETPHAFPEENEERIEWVADLQLTGSASVRGRTVLRGAMASELRAELLAALPHEQRLWLETSLAKRCSGVKLDSFQIKGVAPVYDPLTISYTFRTETFGIRRDSVVVVRPGAIAATRLPDYFRSPSRVQPIRFRFGMRSDLDLTVHVPENLIVPKNDLVDSVRSAFGDAHWSWSSRPGIFRAQFSLVLRGDDVRPAQYPEFQQFLDSVRERDLHEAIFSLTASR